MNPLEENQVTIKAFLMAMIANLLLDYQYSKKKKTHINISSKSDDSISHSETTYSILNRYLNRHYDDVTILTEAIEAFLSILEKT